MNSSELRRRQCTQQWRSLVEQIQAESLSEAEVDLQIRALQAGEGRRGSNVFQSNGSCFDAVIVAMGSEKAWQQLSLIQGELSKRFEVRHRLAPVTPVHVPKGHSAAEGEGDECDEEQRKSAGREFGPLAPRVQDMNTRLLSANLDSDS